MTDIWLKVTGTKAQVKDAFLTLGLDKEMLRIDHDTGTLELTEANHHVSIIFHPNLLTDRNPEVFSGPHLQIKFLSAAAITKAQTKIKDAGGLPAGLEKISEAVLFPNGPTTTWL